MQLPGGAALPLKVALAQQSAPVWVHERHLPLFLIKAYEERVRAWGAAAGSAGSACGRLAPPAGSLLLLAG